MKKDFSSFNINNTFISADKNVEQACAGDYYYNAVLEANTSVNLINTITPAIDSSLLGQTLRLKIQAEVVNYIGGPYYTWRDLPWPDYPPAWFVNQSYITKVSANIVTPHIPGTFSDFSKIEMTAKTSDIDNRCFFARVDDIEGLVISSTNSANFSARGYPAQYINVFNNFRTSLSPSQFANNEFNTIIFQWDEVTWEDPREDKYISLVGNGTNNREVSYKQIKFYDTNGKLVYDLRPDDRSGYNTGKFYNYLDGTVLDMYSDASASATVTDSVYETSDNTTKLQLYNGSYDLTFESCVIGSSSLARAGIVVNDNGNKCAKFTGNETLNSGETALFANGSGYWWGNVLSSVPSGVRYIVTFRYKTDVPRDRFYIKTNYGYRSAQVIGYWPTNYNVICDSYSFSGDWEMLSFELNSSNGYYMNWVVPAATYQSELAVYVDDIVIRKLP